MHLVDISRRSTEKEIIDFPEEMTAQEVETMLGELRLVNRRLGGSRAVLQTLQQRIRRLQGHHRISRRIRVLDVGCGGADIPLELAAWARSRGYVVCVTALDYNLQACRFAAGECREYPEIHVVQADVLHLPFPDSSFDLAMCSAFLHHFREAEVVAILQDLARVSRSAIVVSDLHRHRLAYLGIRLLTALFSRSRAVRHDGPLSVRKGFIRQDLERIVEGLKAESCTIEWRWAFRWTVDIELE